MKLGLSDAGLNRIASSLKIGQEEALSLVEYKVGQAGTVAYVSDGFVFVFAANGLKVGIDPSGNVVDWNAIPQEYVNAYMAGEELIYAPSHPELDDQDLAYINAAGETAQDLGSGGGDYTDSYETGTGYGGMW